MPDFQPYAGPLIALLGSLAVAGVGLYQWKRQHGNPNRAAIAEARRQAAQALWTKLEELNLELRGKPEDRRSDLRMLATELNATFLRNSLYLDGQTQRLANDYLAALSKLAAQMDQADEKSRQEWSDTMAMPEPLLASDELRAALASLEEGRERVKRALLEAAGG